MFSEGMEFGFYDKAERTANKAQEFYEEGQMSQALEALDTALEINPANSAWHFDKALALDSVHRFEDAIAEYELALALNPEDLEILNSLAVDYTRTGQYDRAIEMFEHIEQLDVSYEPRRSRDWIPWTKPAKGPRKNNLRILACPSSRHLRPLLNRRILTIVPAIAPVLLNRRDRI